MLPEHDRYNLDFLYSSRITCFDVCPVILYCFLCAPHFIEMPVTRPIHFVEKTLCPSTICRGTTPPGFFSRGIFFTISFSHLSPQSLIAHAMENGEKEKLDATAYCVAFTGVLGAGLTIFGAVVHFTNVRDIQDGLGIFALIIGILLYWFHVMHTLCKSKTSKYLYWIMSELDFQGYVKELQAAEPQIQWTIQNYHYETKRWKDKDGQEHEKKERVNTHRATTQYDIKGFVDETLSPEQMLAMFHLLYDGEQEDLESNKKKPIDQLFLLCEMPLEYHPTDDHEEQRLENEKQRFFQENTKDTHQDRHSANLISCHHKSHVMVVLREGTDNSHARPWWMNYWIFMLCTLLLLSVPYRVYFFSKCTKINWEVLKHFSHKPETVWSDDPKHSRSKRTDAASKAFRKVKRETPQRTVELPSAWEDPGKDSPDVGHRFRFQLAFRHIGRTKTWTRISMKKSSCPMKIVGRFRSSWI